MAIGDVSSASDVKVWEKRVSDGPRQSAMDAPDIGALRNNYGRLNVIGKLDSKDKEDLYRFNVQNEGKLSLNLQTNSDLRVQIMRLNGSRVVADSDPDAGAAFETFYNMSNGTYDMAPGSYVLKISYAKDVSPTTTDDYAVQMKLGDAYPNDYVTWETQASDKVEIPQPVMNPIVDIFQSFIKTFKEMFS